ncbi:hypothetical protein B0H13DRAFT_2338659 [Mycena leptocephala]|nr:hypothetical protein B0H13DRAFT_2338659 [Mycena leptocephala]
MSPRHRSLSRRSVGTISTDGVEEKGCPVVDRGRVKVVLGKLRGVQWKRRWRLYQLTAYHLACSRTKQHPVHLIGSPPPTSIATASLHIRCFPNPYAADHRTAMHCPAARLRFEASGSRTDVVNRPPGNNMCRALPVCWRFPWLAGAVDRSRWRCCDAPARPLFYIAPPTTQADFSGVSWKMALALLPALEKVGLRVDNSGVRYCEAALDSGHALRSQSRRVRFAGGAGDA